MEKALLTKEQIDLLYKSTLDFAARLGKKIDISKKEIQDWAKSQIEEFYEYNDKEVTFYTFIENDLHYAVLTM